MEPSVKTASPEDLTGLNVHSVSPTFYSRTAVRPSSADLLGSFLSLTLFLLPDDKLLHFPAKIYIYIIY